MSTLLLYLLPAFLIQCGHAPVDTSATGYPVNYWDLKTGSHIAYIHIPSADTTASTTVIFLHGGPGASQLPAFGNEAPVAWYEKLAKQHFDIYIYDQAGSGLSGRMNDPAQYSVTRHINDLECIRVLAGGKPFILIGDSWGATLAARYMARYPAHVVKAIFTSPGSIDFRDWNSEYSATPRFPSGWYDWIKDTYGEKRLHRYIKLDRLMQTNVRKAYEFAGDKEMDKLADEFITAVIFKTCVYHQEYTKSPKFKMEGMGWWASQMTIYDLMNIPPVKDTLKANKTPVLVLRGDTDYLQPGIAEQYTQVFSNSVLIKVPQAGHFIWLDQPLTYREEIEKFLAGNNTER